MHQMLQQNEVNSPVASVCMAIDYVLRATVITYSIFDLIERNYIFFDTVRNQHTQRTHGPAIFYNCPHRHALLLLPPSPKYLNHEHTLCALIPVCREQKSKKASIQRNNAQQQTTDDNMMTTKRLVARRVEKLKARPWIYQVNVTTVLLSLSF